MTVSKELCPIAAVSPYNDLRGGSERTQSTGPPQPVMQARVSQARPRLQAARLRPVSSFPSAVAEPSAAARWAWYTPYTTLGSGESDLGFDGIITRTYLFPT